MTITVRKRNLGGSGNGNDPAIDVDASGGHPDLARTRNADRTPTRDTLPDAESVREWFSALRDWIADRCDLIWSGEIWDIQPPSPRELVDRARDGAWWESDAALLRFAARIGLLVCLAWSVPWYTLAVLGQRAGRAVTTVGLVLLFFHLL